SPPDAPVESISLVDSDSDSAHDPLRAALQRQREDQVNAQRAPAAAGDDPDAPLKLTRLTCAICLEQPTDLTATSCGACPPFPPF
ncbi:MAG: hypothetical protein INR71_03485, partial [Terriglobus roseus]|nr:hypothetical protein [Terriglobus roseus]